MRGLPHLLLFLLAILLPLSAAAQQQRPSNSTLRGMTIDHPERMSGSWEVKGEDAIYGLHIELTTKVDGAPATLTGVRQIFHDALIEVYQRAGPTRKIGEGSWFSDGSPEVQWNAKHLALEHAVTQAGPAVRLDLTFDPIHDIWSGRFRRGSFDRPVTLLRHHPATDVIRSPFVGTWSGFGLGNNCIHIVQTENGSLAGWSDDLSTPGALRYANGIRPSMETFERYGSIALVEVPSPRTVLIELKALTAGCCSITYAGKLTPDGKEIQEGQSGTSAIRRNWTRMRGESCVAGAR
jgi:hypothetical protein